MRARCLKMPDKYAHKWCAHALQSLQSFKKKASCTFLTVPMFECCHSFCALIGYDSTSMCQSMTPITSPQQIECRMLPTHSNTHKCWSIHCWYWCLLTAINLWPFISPALHSPLPPSPLLSQGYRCRYRLCMADQSQPTFNRKYWHSGLNP